MLTSGFDVDALSCVVTARTGSAFIGALEELDLPLRSRYEGAAILVTGGAGFIAGQTLRTLLRYKPARVVVVDTNENALAELVRDLRSEGAIPASCRFELRLADVTRPMLSRIVREDGPFDSVLAFAAAKHVRSERDAVSALHMLNVNINGTLRTVEYALQANPDCDVFIVSTDKAASPASMMGASKRVMEQAVIGSFPNTTTTRFANVAFSSGSLLESWLIRLGRGQVLPVPAETERFFVSPIEAGQLCTSASVAPPGSIVVPASGAVESIDLQQALSDVLESMSLQPVIFHDEAAALGYTAGPSERRVLVTPRDTAGEKPAEVFLGAGESQSAWQPNMDVVTSDFPAEPALELAAYLAKAVDDHVEPNLEDVGSLLRQALANFDHVSSSSRLDDRI
ncbi:MAG: SDR family NAD(P)-dependent oxidoreductase [Actinobacteria bacterium]|nr:SDR family NAD(P)-dependent oxidoreductase [Actinomycetota bacterium]